MPFIKTKISSVSPLSKYQDAVAEDPPAMAFMLSDCVPQVAQRSVVSESSWRASRDRSPHSSLRPLSHHDSGVGKVDLLRITVSPTLNGALHGVETVIAGAE